MLVSWMTTNKCNLKCVHCYQDAEEATDKEPPARGKKMIDRSPAPLQGDDLLGRRASHAPDIYELVAHAASRGAAPCSLERHAHHAPEVAVRLKRPEPRHGHFGDSLDAVKHDRFRGLEHAYDLTMAGIEACKQAGLLPSCTPPSGLEPRRGVRHRLRRGDRRYGALRVLPHPRGRGKFIQETSLEVLENNQLLKDIMTKPRRCPST